MKKSTYKKLTAEARSLYDSLADHTDAEIKDALEDGQTLTNLGLSDDDQPAIEELHAAL